MNLTYAVNFYNENYSSTIKKNFHFQKDGCTFKVMDDYVTGATFGPCVVTSSYNEDIQVGTVMTFHYNIIHTEIAKFLETMMIF